MSALNLEGRLLPLILSVATLIYMPPTWPQSEASSVGYKEAQIKAAFLYRLPKFIRWPDGRVASHFCFAEESTTIKKGTR